MASDIDMCSNALLLIGDNAISSFSEAGQGALVASNLYSDTYRSVLAEHPWSFALKEQSLSKLTQTPDSDTGYSYAYQLPSDMIRLWAIMPFSDYVLVDNLLYSNQSSLLARYVYECTETRLPSQVVKAIEYKLASEFSVGVAEDFQKASYYEQKYQIAISRAKNIDSQGRPQQGIIHSPFIDAR